MNWIMSEYQQVDDKKSPALFLQVITNKGHSLANI